MIHCWQLAVRLDLYYFRTSLPRTDVELGPQVPGVLSSLPGLPRVLFAGPLLAHGNSSVFAASSGESHIALTESGMEKEDTEELPDTEFFFSIYEIVFAKVLPRRFWL